MIGTALPCLGMSHTSKGAQAIVLNGRLRRDDLHQPGSAAAWGSCKLIPQTPSVCYSRQPPANAAAAAAASALPPLSLNAACTLLLVL